jgi:signal transduction histidine kinase/ActR/RegA family two-component response regulator
MTGDVLAPGAADQRDLRRDRDDVTDQLAAANEVLIALGRSSTDPDAVLDTVAQCALRLCRSQGVQVYLVTGEQFELAASAGIAEEFQSYVNEHPLRVDRATLSGRVALDRTIQQVVDVLNDPEYGRRDVQALGGYRTVIAVPLVLDHEVVGTISLWRTQVEPFDERAIAMLTTFAAQAAAAVRNVHLVRALEGRRVELARKVEQLQALNEVGETVSSSLNLDEVLFAIIQNAVRIAECDGGSIMEYVEEEQCFLARTTFPSNPELLSDLRTIRIELQATLIGRAAVQGHPIAVTDLSAVERDAHLQLLWEDGWRSVLAIPVLRDEGIIGAMVVRRKTVGEFSDEILDHIRAFASQSALAVYNARIFRELERNKAELEVASQHKTDFLASMSHELRTPLNAVIGFSEVLLERMFGDLNDRQEEYLRDILNSGRHLLELLNEVLDLSKVEAGQMELEPAVFSVRSAIEQSVALVSERAGAHGIDITVHVDPALDLIESDELRLKQVLLNLLSNAVKFTVDGGHVRLSAVEDAGVMAVEVADDGVGIPFEDQERIFESFQQGRRGPAREEGTGLGLTLCRRIVSLLGGRMTLHSEVGVGSTFGFTIPISGTTDPAPVIEDESPDPTVVVIDDDRASLDLMCAYLDGHGLRVVRARNGTEGMDKIRQVQPSAVLLDLRLPGVDGWEVLRQIRSDPDTDEVPVIIASILDEKSRGMSAGATDYLIKPIARDDLLNALQQVDVLPGAIPRRRPR